MHKILVPMDGSENALRALQHVIGLHRDKLALEIIILNVQPRIDSGHVRTFISKDVIDEYYRDEAEKALAPAKAALAAAGVPYKTATEVGHVVEVICAQVEKLGITDVVMGTRGMGTLGKLILGSVATQVMHEIHVPLTLVK